MTGEDIVYIALHDWDYLWYRRQQLALELSRGNRVLYVEPPTLFGIGRAPRPGLRQIGSSLYVHKLPRNPLPVSLSPAFARFNEAMICWSLRRTMNSLGLHSPLLFLNLVYYSASLIGRLEEKLSIYDCADDYSQYPGKERQGLRQYEERLMQEVDVVLVTTETLYKKNRPFAKHIYMMPNGVEIERFLGGTTSEIRIPAEIASLPFPRLGYVGTIKPGKFDARLMVRLAEEDPTWCIVLVGPMEGPREPSWDADVSTLRGLSNVHFLGERRHEDLPAYLKSFDICLLPYLYNDYTTHVNPLKIYEYLASGKPTVATNIPSARAFAGVAGIAHSHEDFIRLVKEALRESDPSLRQRRIEIARQNSWEARVREMGLVLEAHLAKQGGRRSQ